MKVLIVEDDTMERRALEKLFSICFPTQFTFVDSAMDGRTALAKMEVGRFELVLLDINLPDINGIDILKTIGETYPDTKVIMATAYSDYDHIRASLKNSAFDYLLKPYSMDTFQEAVNSFLDATGLESFGKQSVVARVHQFVEENYNRDIQLEDIADAVGLDKSYLGRIFKKSEGKSVMLYVLDVRIRKADSYLSRGMSVAEAAYAVGFHDSAYFSKCYKKVRGCSPSSRKV